MDVGELVVMDVNHVASLGGESLRTVTLLEEGVVITDALPDKGGHSFTLLKLR